MVKQSVKQNHMKSFLSKKAVITFVFSKLAFLLFGIILTASFFYFLTMQKEIQNMDQLARIGESITDITSAVHASPFPVDIRYEPDFDGKITMQNTSFLLESNGKKLNIPLNFNINQSDSFLINSCIKISKNSETVISECQ